MTERALSWLLDFLLREGQVALTSLDFYVTVYFAIGFWCFFANWRAGEFDRGWDTVRSFFACTFLWLPFLVFMMLFWKD